MIVECINDNWQDAPGIRPIKGNLYEVVHIRHTGSKRSPYFGLAEIKTDVIWTHEYFREVEIDISDATTKVLNELPIEVLV